MFILSKKDIPSEPIRAAIPLTAKEALAVSEGEHHLSAYHLSQTNWLSILIMAYEMAPQFVDNFSSSVQVNIRLFITWFERIEQSTRHIPSKESSGLYACLMMLRPAVAEYGSHLYADIEFLMKAIETGKDGLHFIIDMSDLGDEKMIKAMEETEVITPDSQ